MWQGLSVVMMGAILVLDFLAWRWTRRRCEAMNQRLDVQRELLEATCLRQDAHAKRLAAVERRP